MLSRPRRIPSLLPTLLVLVLCALLPLRTHAIKFALIPAKHPPSKCIWNTAHNNQLVIVTANVGPGESQRVDIEIVDSSEKKNVYLHKKNIKTETRLAVTTHAEGEIGVCFRNFLDSGACDQPCSGVPFTGGLIWSYLNKDVPSNKGKTMSRVIDLDVDIGADAVDYKYASSSNHKQGSLTS